MVASYNILGYSEDTVKIQRPVANNATATATAAAADNATAINNAAAADNATAAADNAGIQ